MYVVFFKWLLTKDELFQSCASLPQCKGFLRFTSSVTLADLLTTSITVEHFWSTYLHMYTSIGGTWVWDWVCALFICDIPARWNIFKTPLGVRPGGLIITIFLLWITPRGIPRPLYKPPSPLLWLTHPYICDGLSVLQYWIGFHIWWQMNFYRQLCY